MGPLSFHTGSPPSQPAAHNSGQESPIEPHTGPLQRTISRRLRRKKAKQRRIDKILSALPPNLTEEERKQHCYPKHSALRAKADAIIVSRRQKHRSYLNFLSLVAIVSQQKPISNKSSYALFSKLYEPGVNIDQQMLGSVDLNSLTYLKPKSVIPPEATINHNLFPVDRDQYTPQSGVIPPTPVNPFTECSDAIRETFATYVTHNQYLAWFATMPQHYLVLGSAFCLIVFYRMCKDLFLTVRFMTGFLFGYRVVHLRHKYSPQSGSLETAKTFSQYLSKVATVAAAFVSLATLIADNRKIDSYSPQSGLDSDDGAKFLGKVTPKVGSTPDKPATSGAPGITSILRRTSNVQPSQQQPKISRKDPNDGPLNGFGVGI